MGLSFHDETSFVEAVSSLQFNTADDPNPNLETESIDRDWNLWRNGNYQQRGDDIGGSDIIQMVDR